MQADWVVLEFRGREGLARLEADWKRLVLAMPDRGPQHTYETHVAYLEHLSQAQDSFVCLALSDGRELRAICPLELGTHGILGRRVRAWGLLWQMFDLRRDVVCPPGEAEARLLPLVVRHLARDRRSRWLVLDFVLETSALWRCLRAFDAGAWCTDLREGSPVFDCERSFGELSARFSRNFKANLRKANNKLAAFPEVRFETAADPESVARGLETFLEVEASGWKGEEGTAIRNQAQQLGFYRRLAELHGPANQCEINTLHADGQCLAAQFCLRAGGRYTILKIGYDERHAQAAPGHLLLQRTLKRCCDDPGVSRLSLVTDTAWHRLWQVDFVPVSTIYVPLSRRFGGPLLRLLRWRFGPARRVKAWLFRVAARVKGRSAPR